MKPHVFIGFGLLFIQSAVADTIQIDKGFYEGAFPICKPFMIDKEDVNGETFKLKDLMKSNRPPLQASSKKDQISYGEALPPITGENALSYIRFDLTSDNYTKGNLLIDGVKEYALYVNGELHSGNELTLMPGRTDVVMQCLRNKEDKDTFRISFATKQDSYIKINYEGKRAYTMNDLMNGPHYGNVKLSPSGKYLITDYYESYSGGESKWYCTITETASQKLIQRFNNYVSLNWLPGKDIIYYTQKGKNGNGTELITLNPETLKEELLATHIPSTRFTLSPACDYLVYSKYDSPDKKKKATRQLYDPDDRQPGWRSRNTLYLYNLKTGLTQQLTFGQTSAHLADISTDGRKLLISFSRRDLTVRPQNTTTLIMMDAQTLQTDTILHNERFLNSFQFSPDGKQLLITGSPECFNGIGRNVAEGQIPSMYDIQMYLYNLNDCKITPLTTHFNPSVDNAVWSAYNNMIYFTANNRDCVDFYSLSPESKEIREYQLPTDVIQRFSISTHGERMAFYGQTAISARTLYWCDLKKDAPTCNPIGEINFKTYSADFELGECKDWNYRTIHGDTIYGRYYLPPHFNADKKYPMIVYYYGGCTPTQRILEINYPHEVLAGQGYIVYVIQPSGTIGFGQEFSARHVNAWGQRTAEDIINGTKLFCKEHPFVDNKKIGCIGASYGGFMTQYLLTQTDIFATAISHAGISNITSYWGGGYWGYSYNQAAAANSYPWNNPDLFVKQSPLFNADKIHTPLLLLHGTADTNVPTTESIQLFTALKLLGREVTFIEIDGENHVITNYNKRMEWQNTIFAWFAKWLKDKPQWWNDLYPRKGLQ